MPEFTKLEWLVPLFVSPIFLAEILCCAAFGRRFGRTLFMIYVSAAVLASITLLGDLKSPNKTVVSATTGFVVVDNAPRPKAVIPGTAIAKVKAVGLNPADYKVINRLASVPFLRWVMPQSPSYDFSGVLTEVGPGCGDLKPGDEVFGQGAGVNREYAVVACAHTARLPSRVSFVQGAAAPTVTFTAMKGLRALKSGDTIVIVGAAGGCGQAALVLSKLRKASEIVCIASSKNKDFLLSQGFTKYYDYKAPGFASQIVNDLKGKVDIVYDTVTSELPVPGPYLSKLMPTVKDTGLYVALHFTPEILQNEYYKRFYSFLATPTPEDMKYISEHRDFFEQLKVAHTFEGLNVPSLEKAYDLLKSEHTAGKIVLTIGDQTRKQ